MSHAHILIVDDSTVNVKLIRLTLEIEGYTVSTAPDAATALHLLESNIPDLVLLDIQMPVMDGLTLTRMLKADARLRHVPIVALTAYAMKGDAALVYQAGCNGYLTKPIDTRTFAATIATILSNSAEAAKAL